MKNLFKMLFIISIFVFALPTDILSGGIYNNVLSDLGSVDLRFKIKLNKTTNRDIYNWLGSPMYVDNSLSCCYLKGKSIEASEAWKYVHSTAIPGISKTMSGKTLTICFYNNKVVAYKFSDGILDEVEVTE